MKIKSYKGNHFEDDKLFCIESKGEEAFSLYKLLILINQLSLNESKKYESLLKKGYKFFFEEAIKDVILWGKLDIDLMDDKNEEYLIKLCDNYRLKLEKFKQTKLEDFGNGIKTA